MQGRGMFIHYCRSLSTAVANRAVEIQGIHAMLAESAFE
jgi:hypothetical protein